MTDTEEPHTLANALAVIHTWDWLIDGLDLPEIRPGETADERTDRINASGRELGRNRQCSIGWHDECSDPDGDVCQCPCHRCDLGSVVGLMRWLRGCLEHLNQDNTGG